MHSRKQNFHQVLLIIVGVTERVRRKKGAVLIDGNCMAHDVEVRILGGPGEGKRHRIVDPADGADGVPYADEVRLAVVRTPSFALATRRWSKSLFEVSQNREIDFLLFDHADGIRNQAFIAWSQQANRVKHSAQRARRVSTATEAKHVNMVVRFEVAHQKL